MLGRGSQGSARTYFLNERETTVPARRSFEVRGNARHVISPNLTARGQVNFFSDITVQQTYSNNIFEASSRERNLSGNVAGSWGLYQLSGTFDVNETFFGAQESTLWGGGPRVTFGQGQRSLPGTPLYFSFGSEYVRLLRTSILDLGPDEVRLDSGLHRFDVTPVLQIPFARWPFFTVNSSVSWRGTYWSESVDPTTRLQVPTSVSRTYLDCGRRSSGPPSSRCGTRPTAATRSG